MYMGLTNAKLFWFASDRIIASEWLQFCERNNSFNCLFIPKVHMNLKRLLCINNLERNPEQGHKSRKRILVFQWAKKVKAPYTRLDYSDCGSWCVWAALLEDLSHAI